MLSPNIYIDNDGYLTIEQPTRQDYINEEKRKYGFGHSSLWVSIPIGAGETKKYKVGPDGRFIELKQERVEK